ncbi:hypothetical protein Mal64_35050 [Pseudobythopirellula maris]|uniref:Uncharacterized protein n=2 Tax=Pseudobythopirellula maris TaxID=2527991 RepID=A0A5C5ZHI8_9BACT|nr:hypothetical protein Mal64_35050 [Pseudobythopirellula maris]
MLEDVESGRQSPKGLAIKQRLISDQIDETVAGDVIQLCILQSRFLDAAKKLTEASSHFSYLRSKDAVLPQWLGATHFMELVDRTEGTHKKMQGCYAASVPRIGEIMTPENGPPMKVVDVEWVMIPQGDRESQRQCVLVPHVYLENESDDEEAEALVDQGDAAH